MARYKDAEEIASVLEKYKNYIDLGEDTPLFVATIECVKAVIAAVPVVDAVEVVRCGECKYMHTDGKCNVFADFSIRPSVSDYCSYGERRK